MITIYRRAEQSQQSQSITKVPDPDHLLTGKLYSYNIMRLGVCRNPGNVMPAFTSHHLQSLAAGERGQAGMGET